MSEPSEILVENLAVIEQIIAAISRRNGMDSEAADEFSAEVKLRLVKDDYAIIRAFRNRSSFPTYIAAVVRRLLLDYRNHEWGKWRASAEAIRLGPAAMELERLLYRDRRPLDEALSIMAVRHPELTRAGAEALMIRLPRRTRRVYVELDEATEVAAGGELAEETSRAQTASRVSSVVRSFINALPEDDQLVFKLHFESEMTVSQIARALHRDQQALYRQLYKHFRHLRRELERAGVRAADITDLIGTNTVHFEFPGKNEDARPSEAGESAVAVGQEEISS